MAPERRSQEKYRAQRGRFPGNRPARIATGGKKGEIAAKQQPVDVPRVGHARSFEPLQERLHVRLIGSTSGRRLPRERLHKADQLKAHM